MELWKVVVDRILSWPVAAIIICVLLRKPLIALLTALTDLLKKANQLSIKHGETTLEAKSDANLQLKEGERTSESALGGGAELALISSNAEVSEADRERSEFRNFGKQFAVVRMKEDAIRAELKRVGYLVPDDELTEVLIRQLSTVQTSGQFERIYRLIFGSQIRFMDYLNSEGSQPSAVAEYFYHVASLDQTAFYADFSDKAWIGFLIQQVLVRKDDENEVSQYTITVLGKDFLLWLVFEGLRRDKPY